MSRRLLTIGGLLCTSGKSLGIINGGFWLAELLLISEEGLIVAGVY